MPGLGFRYVGSDRLPMRLSEFDVERYFALTSDVAAINKRFRHDRRAGAAIQLVFLRPSGHGLGQVSTLPRQLLHYIGQRLGLPTPTIASLRTLNRRYKTLYDHLIWACGYLGLKSIGPDRRADLEAWMRQDAKESLTLDELLQHPNCWLYENLFPEIFERIQDQYVVLMCGLRSPVGRQVLPLIPSSLGTRHRRSATCDEREVRSPPIGGGESGAPLTSSAA